MALLLDAQKSTYDKAPPPIFDPHPTGIVRHHHDVPPKTKASSIFRCLWTRTRTCTHASCGGEFIILSPLTCYVFLLSLNNARNPVVHLEPAPGLFGFTATCGGASHVLRVCSRSFPPSLHNYDTYNLKNFLWPTLRGRPFCPHFYIINTFFFYIVGLFFGSVRACERDFFSLVYCNGVGAIM